MRCLSVVKKFAVDSWLVFVSQVFELRHLWIWAFVMTSFLPLTLVGFLLLFGEVSSQRVIYIVTGSITHAITIQAGLSLGQRIGGMKIRRVFDYYASLPISKLSFILKCAPREEPPGVLRLKAGKGPAERGAR